MPRKVTIVGAGVTGLWQALVLARRGHDVSVFETSKEPFAQAASAYGGTMLAPDCEFPPLQQKARVWARAGLEYWRDEFDCVRQEGSLVVASDPAELAELAERSERFCEVDGEVIAALEPGLGRRFRHGLYFEHEAHMVTMQGLGALLDAVEAAGAKVQFGTPADSETLKHSDSLVIDCRGMAARADLSDLRGVRGERLIVKTDSVRLNRPVRLLHIRQPVYVVPWDQNRFMIGATMIESEDKSNVSVKSALDMLALAYQLHPGFGEAEIIDFGAGVRPAFSDNLPRVIVSDDGGCLYVNGAYRHGFLLAPVLAEVTANYLGTGAAHPLLSGMQNANLVGTHSEA